MKVIVKALCGVIIHLSCPCISTEQEKKIHTSNHQKRLQFVWDAHNTAFMLQLCQEWMPRRNGPERQSPHMEALRVAVAGRFSRQEVMIHIQFFSDLFRYQLLLDTKKVRFRGENCDLGLNIALNAFHGKLLGNTWYSVPRNWQFVRVVSPLTLWQLVNSHKTHTNWLIDGN